MIVEVWFLNPRLRCRTCFATMRHASCIVGESRRTEQGLHAINYKRHTIRNASFPISILLPSCQLYGPQWPHRRVPPQHCRDIDLPPTIRVPGIANCLKMFLWGRKTPETLGWKVPKRGNRGAGACDRQHVRFHSRPSTRLHPASPASLQRTKFTSMLSYFTTRCDARVSKVFGRGNGTSRLTLSDDIAYVRYDSVCSRDLCFLFSPVHSSVYICPPAIAFHHFEVRSNVHVHCPKGS